MKQVRFLNGLLLTQEVLRAVDDNNILRKGYLECAVDLDGIDRFCQNSHDFDVKKNETRIFKKDGDTFVVNVPFDEFCAILAEREKQKMSLRFITYNKNAN